MNRHHPDDELLLSLVNGTLDRAGAIVLQAHVEGCPRCQRSVGLLQATAGALLDAIEPAAMAVGAFDRALAAIDAASTTSALTATAATPRRALRAGVGHSRRTAPAATRPDLPAGLHWPRSLDGCEISPWKSIGPGMRWSRIRVPGEPQANAFLLRMAAGKTLALHTHDGLEMTQVMHGAFHDGRATWRAGDLDAADDDIHHQPVVDEGSECICLVAVRGRVRFDGWIARALGAWMQI